MRKKIEENEKKVQLLIEAAVENVRKLESLYKERVRDLNRYALLFATEEFFSVVEEKYPFSDVREFIQKIKEDIIEKVSSTKKLVDLEYYFRRAYNVNLVCR